MFSTGLGAFVTKTTLPFASLKSFSALRAFGKLFTPSCKHPHKSQITVVYLPDISEKVLITLVKVMNIQVYGKSSSFEIRYKNKKCKNLNCVKFKKNGKKLLTDIDKQEILHK